MPPTIVECPSLLIVHNLLLCKNVTQSFDLNKQLRTRSSNVNLEDPILKSDLLHTIITRKNKERDINNKKNKRREKQIFKNCCCRWQWRWIEE
jgi:hypothetical protein